MAEENSNANVRLICPNLQCRSLLSVPPSARGKTIKCGRCGSRLKVPDKPNKKPAASAQNE